jgi:hypothetical protein
MLKIHVEIFIASRLLSQRQETFTTADLRREIKRLFDDDRPGISTHLSAHCVANAPKNAGTVHNYLWRIEQGLLRTFDPTRDLAHATRANTAYLPDRQDVPEKYADLFLSLALDVDLLCQRARQYQYNYGTWTLLGDNDPRFLHTGDEIRARGFVRADELYEIARWKSPRRAGLVRENPSHIVEKVTRLALSLKDEHPAYAAHLLTVLRGIGLPTASTVLTVADPQHFGIIDIRAWTALNRWRPEVFSKKEQGTFSRGEFMRYLTTIRALAQESGLSCREVDMALWQKGEE